jgi:hypothetical protein
MKRRVAVLVARNFLKMKTADARHAPKVSARRLFVILSPFLFEKHANHDLRRFYAGLYCFFTCTCGCYYRYAIF